MRKKTALIILFLLVLSVSLTPVTSVWATDGYDYKRTQILNKMGDESTGEELLPADNAQLIPDQPSETPVVDVPIASPSVTYYCQVSRNQLGNLESFCRKYGAKMRIYWHYHSLLLQRKAGCIVEVSKKQTYCINQLKKRFHGFNVKNVQLRVNLSVTSVIHAHHGHREEFRVGTLGEMDAVLGSIIKKPYGHNARVFRVLGREFGDMVDSLSVVRKSKMGFGKKRRYLDNPVLTLEMIALDVKRPDKNKLLFSQVYCYKTVSRHKSYKWSRAPLAEFSNSNTTSVPEEGATQPSETPMPNTPAEEPSPEPQPPVIEDETPQFPDEQPEIPPVVIPDPFPSDPTPSDPTPSEPTPSEPTPLEPVDLPQPPVEEPAPAPDNGNESNETTPAEPATPVEPEVPTPVEPTPAPIIQGELHINVMDYDLSVRSANDPAAELVGTLPAYATVEVLFYDGIWCKVKFGETQGFIRSWYLGQDDIDNPWATVVHAGPVHARSAKLVESDETFILNPGDKVRILSENDGWYRILHNKLDIGNVRTIYINVD